ncbi:hypothetical protein [Desulfovibrio sp. 86]|nr:hypothetical protein [Desulfovibrio sp. 86]
MDFGANHVFRQNDALKQGMFQKQNPVKIYAGQKKLLMPMWPVNIHGCMGINGQKRARRVCEQPHRLTLARFFVKLTAVYPKHFLRRSHG